MLSVVGVGTWAIGGDNWDYGWGPQDDADSLRAIHAALDLGVNWVDTAPVYGFGHAEEVVAKALKGHRDEVVLASKFGLLWDEQGKTYRDCRPATVEKEVEDSLRRLQTDHLDIYHQHWPDWDYKTPVAETMEVLARLQDEGKNPQYRSVKLQCRRARGGPQCPTCGLAATPLQPRRPKRRD